MTAPVIFISLDSSKESVGSHVPQVILFDAIPTIILVIPEVPSKVPIIPAPLIAPWVGVGSVTSPAGVLDLPAEEAQERHESFASMMLWFQVEGQADSLSNPGRIFLLDRTLPHPSELGRVRGVIDPGLRRFLTTRKRVRPFPTRRLASDSSHSSSYLDSLLDNSSGSPSDSLSDTSSVRSSGYNTSGQTHSRSLTRVASSRSLDSSLLSAGQSRKRCRSHTTLVPLSTPVLRLIAPTHADLLPPRKRFRYCDRVGYNNENGIGMGVEIVVSDIKEDAEEFKAEASTGGTMEIDVDPLVTGGIFESSKGDVHDLEGTLHDIVHYMSEVLLDRIAEFETAQR
ncbi:hypothetical protein Tco_0489814 [Tanacetum coccineum]